MEHPSISFLLNDERLTVQESPGLLALDFVRQRRRLVGSKEGCKEGDCGACTVLLGELKGDRVVYKPVTSCLLPLADVHGRHLVTIEGLNLPQRALSPIQAAMVDTGGTQCGYCTPGFIVAMTAWLLDDTKPLTLEGLKYAISGNLCRCTGYRPIKDAGVAVAHSLGAQLTGAERVSRLVELGAIPAHFATAAAELRALRASVEEPPQTDPDQMEFFVAGGTDLYVQRGEELPERRLRFLNQTFVDPGAQRVGDSIVLDARMTFETFAEDPLIREAIPQIDAYNRLIASWPMRTRATLGGNIANASPIADMTCLLLALGSVLTLREGNHRRELPLRAFFLDYKKVAKSPTEWIERIAFPAPGPTTHLHWEKVSKRAWLDIATVNAAARLDVEDGVFIAASLALGGVAAIPLYLEKASAFLVGKPVSVATVDAMLAVADQTYTPISDVRGSAVYKRRLARQLLLAQFVTLFPEIFTEEAVYATL